MEYNDIDKLLDKYFDGNTSLEEEKMLRKYFRENKNLPMQLENIRHLFGYIDAEAEETADFEIYKPSVTSNSKRRYIIYLSGIAASIILLIGIYFYFNAANPDKKIYAYINGKAITNEQIAINETKKVLYKVSVNFNEGTGPLRNLSKFNKTKNLLTKNN